MSKIITNESEKEVKMPKPKDILNFLGKGSEISLDVTTLIAMGITDVNVAEYYISPGRGTYYVKFTPHHTFMDISYKNKIKEMKEGDPFPEKPRKTTWTNVGFVYSFDEFWDGHLESIKENLYREVLSCIDIFSANREEKEDPWV